MAAALFGISAPISKVLLGDVSPIPMAALLYLGSGIGTWLLTLFQAQDAEAPLARVDVPWLLGALLAGGVAAPIVLMFSLKVTPAATAALLLNFESIATTLIAALVFRESVGKRTWQAVLLIFVSSALLSWDAHSAWRLSIGALGILAACVLWGVDNTFTRTISAKKSFDYRDGQRVGRRHIFFAAGPDGKAATACFRAVGEDATAGGGELRCR